MTAPHIVTIKHDPESHAFDCHDECTAALSCPGVIDSCRCWMECTTCHDTCRDMSSDALDDFDDRLHEEGEAHGIEHQHIDGMWMTPSERCITQELEHDADYLVSDLPDGEHSVDLDCDEGFVYVTPATATKDA
jgi:hypothetical protein